MSDQREPITLLNATDARNFVVGDTYAMTRRGPRLITGWWAFEFKIRGFASRMTHWWRPRTVCSAIDRDAGSITLTEERWSWRRWRWEGAK